MATLREDNAYFNGGLGWFGPDGPVSFDMSRLISIDTRSLMTALVSRIGLRAFTCVVFIDWSAEAHKGPNAGRRFGGYIVHMDEAAMWTERHLAARHHGARAAYNQIHRQGYQKVTLEVNRSAESQWQRGTAYDPVHDPADAKLWLQR